MTEEADGGPAKLTLGRLCVERVVPVRLEYHAHVDRGPGQPSLSKPRADDETARPSVAGLSRLGSGIFVTSDILFVCCLLRGRAGPVPRTVPSGYEPPTKLKVRAGYPET